MASQPSLPHRREIIEIIHRERGRVDATPLGDNERYAFE